MHPLLYEISSGITQQPGALFQSDIENELEKVGHYFYSFLPLLLKLKDYRLRYYVDKYYFKIDSNS